MSRYRVLWPVVFLGALILGLTSCGGTSHATAAAPVWSATTASRVNVLDVPTGPSGSPDCGASWIANLQNISKATSLRASDAIQIISWNDYEHGDQIEAGIDNCVAIVPSIAGSLLSWQVSGNADAIDHFQVWDSSNGQTLLQLESVPATSRSLSLTNSSLTPGITYALVVQAIGKPSVLNKVSPPVSYTVPANSPAPTVALMVSPPSGNVPLSVSATANVTGTSTTGVSTSIDFGDGTVVAGNSATHTYNTAGSYTVTATANANNGQSGKATASVVASTASNPAPLAQLTLTPTSGVAPLTVSASTAGSSVPGGSIAGSKIDFGDGTVVTGTTASHTYSNPGTYQAVATVTNSAGLSATATSAVTATSTTGPKPASGATLHIYPAVAIAPRGSYQTITAIVNGVNDKTVTWSTSGGTLVGTNPCVVNEPCTIALYTTTPGTYTVTATSNADGSVTAKSTVTITPSPTVTTGHPRLVVTASMLPSLQAKATSGNVMYQAMLTTANSGYAAITGATTWTQSTWNGTACVGGGTFSTDISQSYYENYAYFMAFLSMVAPTPAVRNLWGCRARDIFMAMVNYWQKPSNSVDVEYGLTGNHGSDTTLQMTLVGDWLMGGGYLSSADVGSLRAFFALASKNMISIPMTGSRAPIGSYNSAAQFDTNGTFDYTGQRAMGNNYTHSKEMYLVAAALTFDDNETDDPALPNTCSATRYQVCPDGTAGSLHAYWKYLAGGMLYKDWAHVEDPNVAQSAYNAFFGNLPSIPSCHSVAANGKVPCFGDGRGGESAEGSWYQYSMFRTREALNAIHTAGYDDPILYGPQLSYATSSWWDMKYVSDLHFLTGKYGTAPWISWNYWTTGDSLGYGRSPSDFEALTALLDYNSYVGKTEETNGILWAIMNTSSGSSGGISNFDSNLTNVYAGQLAPDLFIALPAGDPVSSPPSDPRPSLPRDWYNGGNQHIIARSGWASSDKAFSYYCPNTAIDHEHEFCGKFEIYQNNEYITKGRTEFNNYNDNWTTTIHSNLPSYANAPDSAQCKNSGSCYQAPEAQSGGQFLHDYQGGMSTVLLHNEAPTYVAAIVDNTPEYNSSYWTDYSGVTHASRSLIYLRASNQVIYYDRGVTGSNAWEKNDNLVVTGAPTIAGNTAYWLTPSSTQKAYWTNLLPSSAKLTNGGQYTDADAATDSYIYGRIYSEAGQVASTQFLNVLEWGASSLAKSATTLIQSSAGTSCDGAMVGNTVVMFKRNWTDTVSSLTYPASGAIMHYIADLTPNTVYSVSGTGAPSTVTTDSAGVAVFSAAGTGSITVSR